MPSIQYLTAIYTGTFRCYSSSMDDHKKGHRQRLKEKFRSGPPALHDYEIMELLLSYIIPRRDVKALAKNIIDKTESLRKVFKTDLTTISGAGEEVQLFFNIMREFYVRMEHANLKFEPLVLDSGNIIFKFLRMLIGISEKESFVSLFVDKNKRLISYEVVSSGTVDRTAVYPREIAELALRRKASYVIIAHNHPSGSLIPSEEDIHITERISKALETLDIKLLDHIIVTDTSFLSMKAQKLI
ncbi:MAG TPA: DNA repair protein RadC [Deferribacteraceae bacterium]|nr:DNA repair protein RadC [Deferribacteraceae bacterium]